MKRILVLLLIVTGLSSVRASLYQYTVSFSDVGEANASTGTGLGTVDYDNVAHSLALNCSFSGLLGTTSASHIHGATSVPFTGSAGVATTTPTFAGFPLGVTSGTFSSLLDLTQASSWNPSYITANGGTTATAEAAFFNAINSGRAYWNIHSSYGPGGEIRGFLTAVPEPSILALVGLAGIAMVRQARRQKS